MSIPQEVIDKFWGKVTVDDDNKCWSSSLNGRVVQVKKKPYNFNEILYFDKYGEMPTSNVLKICKNNKCCNPNHIVKTKEEYLAKLINNPNNYKEVWNEYLQDYCYSWTKTKLNTSGYAEVRFKFDFELITRWVLILDGVDMNGLFARHLCHNKSCIKRSHLAPGTAADNSQDDIKAGRQVKGERIGASKITEAKALQIIELLKTTSLSRPEIASKVGTTYNIVAHISQGQTWKHLSNMPCNSKRSDWYEKADKQLSFFE